VNVFPDPRHAAQLLAPAKPLQAPRKTLCSRIYEQALEGFHYDFDQKSEEVHTAHDGAGKSSRKAGTSPLGWSCYP